MRGPGGPSRAASGVPSARPEACDGCSAEIAPVTGALPRAFGPQRWNVTQQVSPSRDGDHRAGRGANRLNTARGTPRVWRTCGTLCLFARTRAAGEAHRTSTGLDVARRRGPRDQLDPWRPARPRYWAGGLSRRSPVRATADSMKDGPARGLDKEYGRWRLGLAHCLARLVEPGGRRVPA